MHLHTQYTASLRCYIFIALTGRCYERDWTRILRHSMRKLNTWGISIIRLLFVAARVYFSWVIDAICSKWLRLLQRPRATVHHSNRLICNFNRISRFPPGSPGNQWAGQLLLICVTKVISIPWIHYEKRVNEVIYGQWDGCSFTPSHPRVCPHRSNLTYFFSLATLDLRHDI